MHEERVEIMGAEPARVLDYTGSGYSGYYGSAAPVEVPYERPFSVPEDMPVPHEETRSPERAEESVVQNTHSVSLFALFGAVFAGVLMIFVVLAQINYAEIAGEIVRLNTQFDELSEQQRRLEIEFESAIDMKEIERYARDSLGMSKPETDQIAIIRSMPVDSAEIIRSEGQKDTLSGLGSFITSLLEYFHK